MGRLSLISVLLLALLGIASCRNVHRRKFNNEDTHQSPSIAAGTATVPITIGESVLEHNQIEGKFREQQQERRDNESRFQTGRIIKRPPPFIVGLTTFNGEEFCTASLISKDRILTAAHCFDKNDPRDMKLQAVLGLSDITVSSRSRNKNKPNVSVITFTRGDVVIHDNYTGVEPMLNDIAIVKLKSPVKAVHKPIWLAAEDSFRESLKGAGWGMKDCFKNSDEALRGADAKYVENSACSEAWDQIDETQVCVLYKVGGVAVGAAPGDSGGPLYSEEDVNLPVQVGIASFVHSKSPEGGAEFCTDKRVPQVYTRVSEFTEFIQKNAPDAEFGA